MRSAARKSASPSPTSAETTPTSVTRGKSCPFAIICVPTSTSIVAGGHRSQNVGRCALAAHGVAIEPRHAAPPATASRSRARLSRCRIRGARDTVPCTPGTPWARASRSCSSGSGRDGDRGPRSARSATRCSSGTRCVPPHCRQNTAVARPRRFNRISDCWPASSRFAMAFFNAPAENDIGPVLGVLLAHVDDRHRRERAILHAALHHQARVARRSRRSGCSRATASPSPARRARLRCWPRIDRHVAPVVARRFFLLERRIVLFVDDDQPELRRAAQTRPSACRRRPTPRRGGCDTTDLSARRRTVRCAARPRDRRTRRETPTQRRASARSRARARAPILPLRSTRSASRR